MRHVEACNNAVLPGGRAPLWLEHGQIGWVRPDAAAVLGGAGPDGVRLKARDLPAAGRRLVDRGLCRWRNEAFDVRATPDGPVLSQVDRGALPVVGVQAQGVHLNGLVQRADGPWLWVARRSADKQLDPGKYDHLVAGGVPAGLSPDETLVKEADEEAALPLTLVKDARQVAVLQYSMDRPEGLRRDRLYCYDLVLPDGFVPHPRDGEVAGFELWPLPAVLDAVRRTDGFKFNVNLVLIDLFLRMGLVECGRLRAAMLG